jgi:hypothetical protein
MVDVSLSHEERAERREKIAAFCRTGKTVAQACLRFGVGATLVGSVCTEHNVLPAQPERLKANRLQLIAELVNSRRTFGALGKQYRISRQAVYQLWQRCKTAGLKVTPREK